MDRLDKTDLTDGGTIGIKQIIPDFLHEGAKAAYYQAMRKEFSEGLLDAVERCRHPAVVEISESRRPVMQGEPCTEIEIRARLTPVRYHNINLVRNDYSSSRRIYSGKVSLLDRLRILFTGKI